MYSSLSEEESCLSATGSSSGSEDSDADEEPSVKENAAHVYSELTAIREKLQVRRNYLDNHACKKTSYNYFLRWYRTSCKSFRSGKLDLLNVRKRY